MVVFSDMALAQAFIKRELNDPLVVFNNLDIKQEVDIDGGDMNIKTEVDADSMMEINDSIKVEAGSEKIDFYEHIKDEIEDQKLFYGYQNENEYLVQQQAVLKIRKNNQENPRMLKTSVKLITRSEVQKRMGQPAVGLQTAFRYVNGQPVAVRTLQNQPQNTKEKRFANQFKFQHQTTKNANNVQIIGSDSVLQQDALKPQRFIIHSNLSLPLSDVEVRYHFLFPFFTCNSYAKAKQVDYLW